MATRNAARTDEPGSSEHQLAAFVEKFEPNVAALIRECRRAVRGLLPNTNELVYDNYNFFVIGYSSTLRPSDCIVSLVASASGVALSFYYGASLPDPSNLLLGSSKQNRFIRLPGVDALDRPGVLSLIQSAVAHGKTPPSSKGGGRLIIQSVSARQRPRRKVERVA